VKKRFLFCPSPLGFSPVCQGDRSAGASGPAIFNRLNNMKQYETYLSNMKQHEKYFVKLFLPHFATAKVSTMITTKLS
jgi:hypothetical protein